MKKNRPYILKKGILLDSILGTSFILSFVLLFQLVRGVSEFSFLDPIGDAIGDVEMTDLVFSQIRENPKVDKNVVLDSYLSNAVKCCKILKLCIILY